LAPTTPDDLKQVPLFAELDSRQLRRLAKHFRARTVPAGTVVVREGEMSGAGFFVVADGEAVVNVGGNDVKTVGPGEHFGELALVSEGKRSATITARTELQLYEIPFWDFREFAHANPDVTWKLLQHVVGLVQPPA
jgi:CRP-like cAMP-binding protein